MRVEMILTWLRPGRRVRALFPRTPNRMISVTLPEIEPYAAPIGAAVLTDFVPDDVTLVLEAPSLHYGEAFRKQCVGNPKIQVRRVGRSGPHRQRLDLAERHRSVA